MTKLLTGVAAAALACALAAPAAAQDQGLAPNFAEAARPAEAAASPDDGFGDVIVTARRRAEDAQKVPGALSVVGGALLDRSYTVNTQGLANLVPTLNYSSANPRNTAFTIRGLGSSVVAVSQANDGLEPGVGYYVDQVYHARPATAAFDFADVDQVEVLRGPQGTLFGKNTTAGAINITSRAPTFTPEAYEELSYGDYNLVQVKAYGSGPISDTLAFRVSGLVTRRDGVIRNVRTGEKQNAIGNQAVKGQLLYKPSDTFQARLIADFSNFESVCCTQVFLRVGQTMRSPARQYPALAAKFGYQPASYDPYDRVTDIDADLGVSTNEGGAAAIVDWKLGFATLTSVSAWRFWNWDAANDRDYTGIPIQLTQHIPSRQDQYSQELRLASTGDGPLSYVGGLYFFRQKIAGRPISIYGSAGAGWLLPTRYPTATPGRPTPPQSDVPANLLDGYGSDGRTRFVTDSYAAFGEANYRITDRLTATAGLRYTYEEKEGNYATSVFGGAPTTAPNLISAKLSILRPQSYAASDKDGSLSGRGNLAYQITDGILGYASYARGFKSGGINMSGLPLDAANQPALSTAVVRPEKNTTYEVGVKSRLFDRRLVLNLAGFWTEVKDFQATIVDNREAAQLRGYLSNIPKVRVRGIEADAVAQPIRNLSLRGGLAFADGKSTDYPAGPCPLEVQTSTTVACSLTGRVLPNLPRWTETLGVDYALPVANGRVIVHSDTSWRSGYYGDPTLSRYTYIKAYSLTNASIAYRSDHGWEAAVFARNLFDADYIQNLTIQAGNSGLILGTPSDPRVIGVTFRAWQ